MKVKAKVEAIGNSEVGNRQRMVNSEKGIGKRPCFLIPIGYWLFPIPYANAEPKTLYTPFSIGKNLGGENEKNDNK